VRVQVQVETSGSESESESAKVFLIYTYAISSVCIGICLVKERKETYFLFLEKVVP